MLNLPGRPEPSILVNLYGSLINWVRWASSFFSLWDLWALSLHSCPHSSVVRFFIPSFSLVPPCLHFLSRVLISILSCKICFTLLLGSWQFLPCCLFSAQLVLRTWPLTLTPKWYGSTIIVCVCVSVPLFLVGWVSGVVLWVPHSWGVEQLLGVSDTEGCFLTRIFKHFTACFHHACQLFLASFTGDLGLMYLIFPQWCLTSSSPLVSVVWVSVLPVAVTVIMLPL